MALSPTPRRSWRVNAAARVHARPVSRFPRLLTAHPSRNSTLMGVRVNAQLGCHGTPCQGKWHLCQEAGAAGRPEDVGTGAVCDQAHDSSTSPEARTSASPRVAASFRLCPSAADQDSPDVAELPDVVAQVAADHEEVRVEAHADAALA